MLVWLADFAGTFPVLNVFRYITFRAGGNLLAAHQAGQGPADPHGRA